MENKLSGVVQIAVKPEIDLTFATGLRSILRGDPNVVMIGEIRDLETAEIAIRASLTGHLVFSTLHTNDAIGGITRLVDMGVEPFLVSSSVRAFLAQRLVRTLCPQCKQPAHYSKEQLTACGFAEGIGKTIFTRVLHGLQSRAAARVITADWPFTKSCWSQMRCRTSFPRRPARNELLRQARKDGFISLREYGWRKVLEGVTTVEEVMRVTSEDFLD